MPLMSQIAELDTVAQEAAALRPLPAAALRVLQIADGEHFSAHELTLAISADLALTARILRLANSPFFGFPRRIATVRDAIVYLGVRAVRSAAVAACVAESIPPEGDAAHPDRSGAWRFAVATGLLAEVIAKAEGHHADLAFTAGVIHDIGRMLLAERRPQAFAEAVTLAHEQGITLPEAERQVLGFTDGELGHEVARRWNFPGELVEAVGAHEALTIVPGSLAELVVAARSLALIHHLADGAEPPPAVLHPVWSLPAVQSALAEAGGVEAIAERAALFVDQSGER